MKTWTFKGEVIETEDDVISFKYKGKSISANSQEELEEMHVGVNYTTEEAVMVPQTKMYKYMYPMPEKPSVMMVLQPDGYYRGSDDVSLYLSASADHNIVVDYDTADKTVIPCKYLTTALMLLCDMIDSYDETMKEKLKKPKPPKPSKGSKKMPIDSLPDRGSVKSLKDGNLRWSHKISKRK